jgi:hypothetical protein
MLDKIKGLSHKKIFALGITMVLIGGSMWFNLWTTIGGGILSVIGFLLIIIAHAKKQSTIDKS